MMDVKKQLELEKRVFKFVADCTGKKVHELNMDSRLYHDLQIDGVDAYTLLMDFCLEFGLGDLIDFRDFRLERHFSSNAGSNILMRFSQFCMEKIFGMEMPPTEDRFIPITIEDLVYAAKYKAFPDLSTRAYQKREK